LKTLTTFLGPVIGDIARGIEDKEALEKLFAHPFMRPAAFSPEQEFPPLLAHCRGRPAGFQPARAAG
jgi:hypothetical protein